jgi:oleate hydratase
MKLRPLFAAEQFGVNGGHFMKAHLIGGGIGSLAAAAFMIRDGNVPGDHISIYESNGVLGGSLDGVGNAVDGYRLRGGRMLTTDNYECTRDLFKTIPSIVSPDTTVFEETVAFNKLHLPHSKARLVDRNGHKVDVSSMGFSMADRIELLKITEASEDDIGASRITDWLSPPFFLTKFWFMWSTTFAFQPWHSAIEFKRYVHRFMLEFTRIETLTGVKRTVFNQYNSLVCPLVAWLRGRGVNIIVNCTVTDLVLSPETDEIIVCGIVCTNNGIQEIIPIPDGDFVFFQNGSMTDASSFGSMSSAPAQITKTESDGWTLWENLAEARPELGNPSRFNSSISESFWESFTVTLHNAVFFERMEHFTANEAGTGGLVTFFESNWLLSVVLPHQPHFPTQPDNVKVFWGYALHPDRIGNFVPLPMSECSGKEILRELRGHLNFDRAVFEEANCIPCRMPYITSMFMPRHHTDRPRPVPKGSKNLAFISQFVEIADDVVFTVEYSVRAAQIAVYQMLAIDREVTPIQHHDQSLGVMVAAAIKAFK